MYVTRIYKAQKKNKKSLAPLAGPVLSETNRLRQNAIYLALPDFC